MWLSIRMMLISALVSAAAISPTQALVRCDFEGGTDWAVVGSDFAGLTFGGSGGGAMYYADIADSWSLWPMKSDNGKENDDWRFFISGDVAGFSDAYVARIDLTYGLGSYFEMDYSSQYSLMLSAYDASGSLLTQSLGDANYRDHGTDMKSLRVDNAGISYVTVEAMQGDFPVASCWVIDNIESDAPSSPNAMVPEWPSLMLGLMGLGVLKKSILHRHKHRD